LFGPLIKENAQVTKQQICREFLIICAQLLKMFT